MTPQPGSAPRGGPIADLADEELVRRYQYLKSEAARGEPDEEGLMTEVESEMRRRGLQPDREDVIPDRPLSNEAEVKPAH